MKIKISGVFLEKLNQQIDFIARDKPGAARKFKNDILARIRKISRLPMAARRSVYFEDDHIREIIFKGYKIIYRIKPTDNEIEVFGFLRSQESP